MRISMQCIYDTKWVSLAKLTVPNIVGYCVKHGYDWNIQAVQEYKSDSGYDKLREIRKLFENNKADVVVSLDCDLHITNYNIKIEDFLNDTFDFYITHGANTYNAGVFILKKSGWAYWFIDYLLSCQGLPNMHCEQDAIMAYINEFGTKDICVLPHPSINSFMYDLYPEYTNVTHQEGNWQEGDFILHLPGVGMDKRHQILSNVKVIK